MHWAHANTAVANNYSIGLITIAYKKPGSSLWVQQWAVLHFEIQTYFSRGRGQNAAATLSQGQNSITWPSPPTHQMCRERRGERDSSVLRSCVPGKQGPSLALASTPPPSPLSGGAAPSQAG